MSPSLSSLFSHKRGVSPLIATILLIAFAVALGSVLINWGLNLDLNAQDPCTDVGLTLRQINDAQACYGGERENGYVNFILNNVGSEDIDGLSVWIIGDRQTKFVELSDLSIPAKSAFEKRDRGLTYDYLTHGNIQQMQFIPKVRSNGETEICTQQAVKAQILKRC